MRSDTHSCNFLINIYIYIYIYIYYLDFVRASREGPAGPDGPRLSESTDSKKNITKE